MMMVSLGLYWCANAYQNWTNQPFLTIIKTVGLPVEQVNLLRKKLLPSDCFTLTCRVGATNAQKMTQLKVSLFLAGIVLTEHRFVIPKHFFIVH